MTLSSLLFAGCGGISEDSNTSDNMYYDYFYYDEDGELYVVRIHLNEAFAGEIIYDVHIYYNAELVKEYSEIGKSDCHVWKIKISDFQMVSN